MIFAKVSYHLFADDTVINLTGYQMSKVVAEMNNLLKIVSYWMVVNKLNLFLSKTKGMIIGKASFRHKFCAEKLKFKVSPNTL